MTNEEREKAIDALKISAPVMAVTQEEFNNYIRTLNNIMDWLTEAEKIGHCRDCKQWRDHDGLFRRGVRAESRCPINRREVFEGNGYCYMFEPKESEVKDEPTM